MREDLSKERSEGYGQTSGKPPMIAIATLSRGVQYDVLDANSRWCEGEVTTNLLSVCV